MTTNQVMDVVTGANNLPAAVTLAAGHFWRQPFRLGLQADDGQADELEQAGGEPYADRQDVLTWCYSEN